MPDKPWKEIAKMTPLQRESYFEQLQASASKIIYDGDLETAAELKKAGWTPEPVHPADSIYQWRWRRPGKRGGTLFMSPTSALTALRKTIPLKPS